MRAIWTAVAGFVLILPLVPGCVAPSPRGRIPVGEWCGQGRFVYERWAKSGASSTSSSNESRTATYPTTLSIRPGRLDGRDVVEFVVHSDRGPITDLGDRTHLRVALVEAKRTSDSTVLYRLVGFQFNPGPQDHFKYQYDSPPVSASCTTNSGVTTFQIEYTEDFVETFRFHGNRVEKSGILTNREQGLVHWSERLIKHRP